MPARLIQDWVLEMWGWSIAAASMGIRHKIRAHTTDTAYAPCAEQSNAAHNCALCVGVLQA